MLNYGDSSIWRLRRIIFVVTLFLSVQVDANSFATLDGKSLISMSVSKEAMYSIQEYFSLSIKTREKDGFLFYTGNQATEIHMALFLRNGRLQLLVKNGIQTYKPERPISCPKGLFSQCDDNQWHAINVTWGKREVTLEVDGKRMHRGSLRTEKLLSSRMLYIGGYPKSAAWVFRTLLNGDVGKFKGCMRQVLYSPESMQFDLITMAKKGLKPVSSEGKVKFDRCEDQFASQPISFRISDAYLKIRASWRSTKHRTLVFRFKTTEEGGLIFYQKGNGSNADFIAFELRKTELYLLLNAGSGTKVYNAAYRNVTDGKDHLVHMEYNGGKGTISLDRRKTLSFDLNKNSNLGFREMNMNEHIFIGSLPSSEQILAPHELWSAKLRKGYVGCFSDLRIDKEQIDLVYEARRQRADRDNEISLNCTTLKRNMENDGCPKFPCLNGGTCKPGWDRFLCDCTNTFWTGYKCQNRAPVVRFDGAQKMMIRLPMEMQSEAEDVLLRFKTRQRDGLLFGTHSPLSSAQDRLALLITHGKLLLVFNFGKGNKTKLINAPISDNKWHTVSIHRRALQVTISLDNEHDIAFDIDKRNSAKLINMRNIAVGYYKEPGQKFGSHFIGHMMHFTFNGINYFEMAASRSSPNLEITADMTSEDIIRPYPVSFITEDSYITLPTFKIQEKFILRFWFKTNRLNGIILYNTGNTGTLQGDFVLLELAGGSLNFVFRVGGASINRVISPTASLDDDRWHEVQLSRVVNRNKYDEFIFLVDGKPPVDKPVIKIISDPSRRITIAPRSRLYLGGVEDYQIESNIFTVKTGFQGCLAALLLNREDGLRTNPLSVGKVPPQYKEKIEARCRGQGRQCQPGICYYGGQCIQQWRRVRCNCELTSFSGPQCQQVSSAVRFGPGMSRITLEMLDRTRNTRRDELAFGIQTESKEATLVHVVGQGNKGYGDYIKVEVVGSGFVQVSYDMGSNVHQVTETRREVNDGRYHIIRLIREGPDTVLKVDEFEEKKIPKAPQLNSHFNRQKWIYLGAPRPPKARIRRRSPDYPPYDGIISGMVFNGLRVTDLITRRIFNPHIHIRKEGSVQTHSNFVPNLNNFPPPLTNLTDSPSSTTSFMQSTSGDKRRGSTNGPDGTGGIISPHIKCKRGHSGDCNQTSSSTGIITPVVTFSSTPSLNKQNSRPNLASPTPLSPNVPGRQNTRKPSRAGHPKTTAFPVGLGGLNVWLVVAIACGGALVLLLVVCIIYRCRHKADEGSYSVEHHQREFGGDPACKPLRRIPGEGEPLHMNGGATPLDSVPSVGDPSIVTFSRSDRSSNCSDRKKKKRKVKPSRKETREWYV